MPYVPGQLNRDGSTRAPNDMSHREHSSADSYPTLALDIVSNDGTVSAIFSFRLPPANVTADSSGIRIPRPGDSEARIFTTNWQ